MIPQHVLDELKSLSQAQQSKFQDLVMWSSSSGLPGQKLPIDYDSILAMVKRMGEDPITPIEPIIPPDPEMTMRDLLKKRLE